MNLGRSQDLSQQANLAPDWLHKSEQQIRSQVSKLTQFLTMTTTHKFPSQIDRDPDQLGGGGGLPENRFGVPRRHVETPVHLREHENTS